jgi:hypothetical protein
LQPGLCWDGKKNLAKRPHHGDLIQLPDCKIASGPQGPIGSSPSVLFRILETAKHKAATHTHNTHMSSKAELRFARRPRRHSAFLGWASSSGSSLTSLHLSDMPDSTTIRQLPCPNLLELRLSLHLGSVLCASSEGLGLLHSCTALTRLNLEFATLLDSVGGLAPGVPPTAAAQLKHLELRCCELPGRTDRDGTAGTPGQTVPWSLLPDTP